MLTFHADAPALSAPALRRLEMMHFSLGAVLGGMAGLFAIAVPIGAFLCLGATLALELSAEVALRRWARRRGLTLISRRDWRAAWRGATYAAPVPWILARALLFGVTVAQLAQGRPAWALDANGWAAVVFGAVLMILVGFWNRGSVAADAWAAAQRDARGT